jgi:hypothetical protein
MSKIQTAAKVALYGWLLKIRRKMVNNATRQ